MRYLSTVRRTLLAGALLGVLIAVGVLLINTFVRPHVFPSPARWSQSEYHATPNVLCPGQTFTYTPTFSVEVRPGDTVIVERGAAWKLERTGMLAVTRGGQTVTTSPVSTPFDRSTSFTRTVTVTVPDFPPEQYGYYGWADVKDRDDYNPVYKVVITIPETCGAGGFHGSTRLAASAAYLHRILGAGDRYPVAGAVMRRHLLDAAPTLISLGMCALMAAAWVCGVPAALTGYTVALYLTGGALLVRFDAPEYVLRARRRRMYERVLSLCVWLERTAPRLAPVWLVVWRWAWDRAGV